MKEAFGENDEYAVISFSVNPAVLSLVCAAVPFLVGLVLDDLPGFAGGRFRPYIGRLFDIGLYTGIAGAVLGLVAARDPRRRRLGIFAFALNVMILVLYGLFIYLFRWILSR